MSLTRRVLCLTSAAERSFLASAVIPRVGAPRITALVTTRPDRSATYAAPIRTPAFLAAPYSPSSPVHAEEKSVYNRSERGLKGCSFNRVINFALLKKVANSCTGSNAKVTRGIVTMATVGGDASGSSSAAASAVGADEGVGEILAFWFGDFMRPGYDGPAPAPSDELAKARVWFSKNDDVDAFIRTRFTPLIPLAASGQLAGWEDTPHGALALLVLLDQFTRNSFRGSPEAFAQDHLALEVAKRAIDKGFDRQVPRVGRPFFYLPFEHAEDLAAQDKCIELMTQMVEDAPEGPVKGFFKGGLDFAHKHRNIIVKFGRYPHRNDVLGRESTPTELEFMKTHAGF